MELNKNQRAKLCAILLREFHISSSLPTLPTLTVSLPHLITTLTTNLAHIVRDDPKLNGGAATHVVSSARYATYTDIDVVFPLTFDVKTEAHHFQNIRDVVLAALIDFFPVDFDCSSLSLWQLSSYVDKMAKVPKRRTDGNETDPDADFWSLISLRNASGLPIELKFVRRMRRPYQFPTDSFAITLPARYLATYAARPVDKLCEERAPITFGSLPPQEEHKNEPTNPRLTSTFPAENGGLEKSLEYLRRKQIFVDRPHVLRGGGLLRLCRLLCDGFTLCDESDEVTEKKAGSMVYRFLMDYADDYEIWRVVSSFCARLKDSEQAIFLQTLLNEVRRSRAHGVERMEEIVQRLMEQTSSPVVRPHRENVQRRTERRRTK